MRRTPLERAGAESHDDCTCLIYSDISLVLEATSSNLDHHAGMTLVNVTPKPERSARKTINVRLEGCWTASVQDGPGPPRRLYPTHLSSASKSSRRCRVVCFVDDELRPGRKLPPERG